ncbi:MAG: hemerythrin domain-containing protein [Bryobacteraceae bacterium]
MSDASQSSETWNDRPLNELMNHIVTAHHAFCRHEVIRLSSLFKEVVGKHTKDYPDLKRMEALFAAMAKDLQMHLVKEEQTLFPYIARVEEAVQQNTPVSWPAFGTVENPIRMMVLEHDQTGQELSQIRRLSNGYTPPSGAPESLAALFDSLRVFDLDMNEHIHAEDHLLFPRAIAMEEQACAQRKPV